MSETLSAQAALDGIRARHGDVYADELVAILERMERTDNGLKAIVAAHFGIYAAARAIADRMLAVVRLRAHGVAR